MLILLLEFVLLNLRPENLKFVQNLISVLHLHLCDIHLFKTE